VDTIETYGPPPKSILIANPPLLPEFRSKGSMAFEKNVLIGIVAGAMFPPELKADTAQVAKEVRASLGAKDCHGVSRMVFQWE